MKDNLPRDASLEWRMVHPDEAVSVFEVHRSATDGMDQRLVRADSLDYFTQHTGNSGITLGGFAMNSHLVAYGVLALSSPTADKMAALLEIGGQERKRFGVLDGAAVRPEWRARHLHQQLVHQRVTVAECLGLRWLAVTVAPENTPSVRCLLNENFLIVGFFNMYGGVPRLLMMRDLATRSADYKLRKSVLAPLTRDHSAAVEQGLVGYDFSVASDGQLIIHYGAQLG